MEDDPPKDGEVLPPNDTKEDAAKGDLNILALVANYTNRPDLFLAEVEKHDPGFIKRFNESAGAHSEQIREGKYHFGRWQAYTSLGIQVIAAVMLLGTVPYLAFTGNMDFGSVIALTIFYAVTQSGTFGFSNVTAAFSKAVMRFRKNGNQS